MADVDVPAFPKSIGAPVYLDAMLTKLAPVAGEVLVLQTPVDASLDQVMHILSHLNQIAPEGVAMLQKPDVTH